MQNKYKPATGPDSQKLRRVYTAEIDPKSMHRVHKYNKISTGSQVEQQVYKTDSTLTIAGCRVSWDPAEGDLDS